MLDETVTSNSLNSMPHLSNILQILSKNDPLRVRIVSIILAALNPYILFMLLAPAFVLYP